jgi:hypothetical protein
VIKGQVYECLERQNHFCPPSPDASRSLASRDFGEIRRG